MTAERATHGTAYFCVPVYVTLASVYLSHFGQLHRRSALTGAGVFGAIAG